MDKYEIIHLAINYNDLQPVETPWKMVPAGFYHPNHEGFFEAADPYGFSKINTYVESFNPDVTFINNDFPVVANYLGRDKPTTFAQHDTKKVIYSPLDSVPFPRNFSAMTKPFDKTIAYSYWQKEQMLRSDPIFMDLPVIYHGVDTETYFPIEKEEAKKRLGEVFKKYNKGAKIPDFRGVWIVYFVGTNQWRKDIPALFRGYAAFRERFADQQMFLIPHTSAQPMSPNGGGWSLYNLRDLTGLRDAVLMQNANIFTAEEMNIFYNAADVLAYPTRGEGFGLPSLEAMATKTAVIATRFGPQFELHSEGRGYFIDVDDYEPGNVSAFTYFAKPSWRSLAQQLAYVYTHPDEAREVAERAYKWALLHTWDKKAQQLDKILESVCQSPLSTQSKSQSTQKRRKKR
jgi:glycosyltransferase involved in cell wall biosynthesis